MNNRISVNVSPDKTNREYDGQDSPEKNLNLFSAEKPAGVPMETYINNLDSMSPFLAKNYFSF